MQSNKQWDVFCSYSPGEINQKKVIDIRNQLVSNLNITTWIDKIELQSGERTKKIYEGITNSTLFLCFVTPEYSDNKDCINELCLAKNFNKELIFFINEDTTGMNQEMLTKNILKEVSFYMGDAIYYRKREELFDAIKKALNKEKKSPVTDQKSIAVFSFDHSKEEIANKLMKKLEPLFDAQFLQDNEGSSDQMNAISNCAAFIALVDSKYYQSDECKSNFAAAIENSKPIIRLNLEESIDLNEKSYEFIINFDLYKDTNQLYLNGEGRLYINIVYQIEKTLPKSIVPSEKKNDVLVITPESYEEHFEKLYLKENVKFSNPSDSLNPNFALVKDSKVIIAVIDDEINKNEKAIEELKFALLSGSHIITIEDNDIQRLNSDLKEILKSVPHESQFHGTENLITKKLMRDINSELRKTLIRIKAERDMMTNFVEVKNDKLLEEEKNRKDIDRLKRNLKGLIIIIIMLCSLLTIGYMTAVAVGAVAISKDYFIEVKNTTRATTVITSTSIPKWNNCSRSTSSPSFPNQEYTPFTTYTTKFKKKVQAVVEICFPENFYVVNFGDSLVLTDGDGLILKKSPINTFLNKKNVSMVGTNKELIVSDNSSFLYRFTFDLDALEPKNFENGLTPVKLTSLYYDFTTSILYVYEKKIGIHKLDSNLQIFDTIPVAFDIDILFQINRNPRAPIQFQENVYFAFINDSTRGFYDASVKNTTLKSQICDEDSEITSFFIDPDNFLYATCSYKNVSDFTEEFYSTINIMKFNGDDFYNQLWKLQCQITSNTLDSKNRLVVTTYNGYESALEFLF